MTSRAIALFFAMLLSAPADTLILKDGTRITGRWWSIDANEVHFLVNSQLQHYRRAEVSAVTFGDAALPAPPTPTAAPAPAAQPPAAAPTAPAEPTLRSAPTLARPEPLPASSGPPTLRSAPSLSRPGPAPAPPPAEPSPAITEPEQIGQVYFRNGSGELLPLEKNQAAERRRGSTQYWEILGINSPVRFKAAPEMQFVVRVASGSDEIFSLYPMTQGGGFRRTESQPGRRPAPVTLPFTTAKSGESIYIFTVKGLAAGEYSFSPSGSNDAYCFGVDSAAPAR